MQTIRSKLESIDIYGQDINFTFRGKSKYNTLLGGSCSLVSLAVVLFYYTFKTLDFVGRIDPRTSMIENVVEPERELDLNAMRYRFAVTAPKNKNLKVEFNQVVKLPTNE